MTKLNDLLSEDTVTIIVNGEPIEAPRNANVIEVTDQAGITVPRFCYHKKLSVAGNCRMCLVEVEKSWKPLPACATPVSEGMVIHTNSPRAIAAQKSTMEFLLINHPLDCPVCDQGGECELQDVAVGFGDGVGAYSESKRVVQDKDIGALIATDMTRCIHCTRCVRFGEEIAGLRELGATGRSEFMEIGTYIEKSITHELSGNVIDLCPVGALTSKPARYKMRPWELKQHAGVAPHDGTGSNVFFHSRDNQVMRVVPKENESINETWMSDRDRFSYEGLQAQDRLTQPMVKRNGNWFEVTWDEALEVAAVALKTEDMGCLIGANSTLEEHYLTQMLVRGLGSNNIDHRIAQTDFSDDQSIPVMPWLGHSIAEIDAKENMVFIGCDLRSEQPILAHRVKQAANYNMAKVGFVNVRRFDYRFDVFAQAVNADLVSVLAGIAKEMGVSALGLEDVLASGEKSEQTQAIASLLKSKNTGLYLGAIATNHPQSSVIRQLVAAIAHSTGTTVGVLAQFANSAGAFVAGALPHRGVVGQPVESGRHAADMLTAPNKTMLMVNVEAEDTACINLEAFESSFVVNLVPFASESTKRISDVLLPIAPFSETSGTYINMEGLWQANRGVARNTGNSRPAWRVLRVLGNLTGQNGFEYMQSQEVLKEIQAEAASLALNNDYRNENQASQTPDVALRLITGVGMYDIDCVVRRADSLQHTLQAEQARSAIISRELAAKLDVVTADTVTLIQGDRTSVKPVLISDDVPVNAIWVQQIDNGLKAFTAVDVRKGEGG